MHLTVNLAKTDGPDPPYDHNYMLSGAVYGKIENLDASGARKLHDGHGRSPFVLSEIHRVPGKPTEAWFRAGTSREDVAALLEKALAPGMDLTVGPTRFNITGSRLETPVARPGEFATLSPILLTNKATGRSVVHDTPGYREFLEGAVNAQIRNNTRREGTVRVLRVEPQAVRQRTIKERTVLAQKARLLLDGPEEELRYLVDHGIGRSPALGFGMVVGQNGPDA